MDTDTSGQQAHGTRNATGHWTAKKGCRLHTSHPDHSRWQVLVRTQRNEPWCTSAPAGRQVVQPPWEVVWRVLKKSNTELPNDPGLPLLVFTQIIQSRERYWHTHAHSSITHSSSNMEMASALVCIHTAGAPQPYTRRQGHLPQHGGTPRTRHSIVTRAGHRRTHTATHLHGAPGGARVTGTVHGDGDRDAQ